LRVIPAIDIKDGYCVRLKQGQMSEETLYSKVPKEMAQKWYHEGAERIHIVDLNGAVNGKPVNEEAIREIVESVPLPIQLGGGIRSIQTIENYLNLGVQQVILGTAAFKDSEFVIHACERFPGQIILGIDANKGKVAIEGWTEETDITPAEMAKKYEGFGISAIIYTDIERDGMRTGPNIEATKVLASSVKTPVIASGGISDINDIKKILTLEEYGVTGVITGKAIYEGTLNLFEAIKLARSIDS
jgi:phosphoribosylformimino-5-aminoimidazole carboxamide ribotide isomerase